MKKRMYKKWIGRYITPLIKDLPKIERYDRDKHKWVSLINGEDVPEGCAYKIEHDPLKAINKQALELKRLLESCKVGEKKVWLRLKPEALIFDNNEWHKDVPRKKHPRLRFYGIKMYLHVER